MTGIQAVRIVFLFLLPSVAGVLALVGQRRRVTTGNWRGNVLIYGPVIGATTALAMSAAFMAASVAAGH